MVETKANEIIPTQLRNNSFGFVKVRAKTKKPFEEAWQKNPYSFDQIQSWIDDGGNYGVQGGYGGLIIIDADTPEIDEIVTKYFPETFTVKTPGQGHHYYFFCEGIDKKIVLKKEPTNEEG